MAASFPTSIKSFTAKIAGDTVQPAHVNDLQDEVVAVETQLMTWTAYTPVWTNSGTANTLGNGTLTGTYRKVGTQVFFQVELVWGSTTVSGSAQWNISLPVSANATFAVAVQGTAYDTSAATYYPVSGENGTQSTLVILYHQLAAAVLQPLNYNVVGSGGPFTWETGDVLRLRGWFIQN